MFDSMTLFGQLMSGKIPHRVPVALNLLEQGAAEMGMSVGTYYSRAETVAEGQLRLHRKYGHDIVWGTHYIARQAEILGARRTIFPMEGPPNVGELIIKSNHDIEKLTIPNDIEEHPSFRIQADTIQQLRQELAGTTPICAFLTGTFTLPSILMGMEAWMTLFLTGSPSLVEELLTKCSEYTVKTFAALKKAGADLIAYANPMVSTDFFSLPQIKTHCLRWIKRDMSAMGTNGLVYFCGGARINNVLSLLCEQTDIGAFLVHPDDDIATAKSIVGSKAIIIGAVNDIQLVSCTNQYAEESTRKQMEDGVPGGGFILGSLVMPYSIPERIIHTVIETAHRYGSYGSYEKA